MALALVAAVPPVSGAPAEEPLTAALAGDLRSPPRRCEWIAGEFATIERLLSIYRSELASLYVAVDGRTIGDSAGGTILAVEFDSWRTGPASMAIGIDGSRLPSPSSLVPGRRIEAWFGDRDRRSHPLFCGELAVLRTDAVTRRIDVLAVSPRPGSEGRSDARYLDVTGAEVLKRLAATAGLALEIQDQRRRENFALLERRQLADWPFMRQVARQSGYELVLLPGGKLLATESTFLPPAPPSRQWNDVTLADIAHRIARDAGRLADARLSAVYPAVSITQTRPDDDFMAAIALGYRVSAWFEPGRLLLAEDGAWTAPPAVPALAFASAPDELLSRISILGSADGTRAFRRMRADPKLRQDPERTPVLQTTLLAGRAMRVAEPPRFELADYAATASALEGAIARLERSERLAPEQRFLIGYARSHRPTLLHVYRRMPGGLQALDAIGR